MLAACELMAPAGTPPAVVALLADAVQQVLKDPQLRAQFESQGTVAIGSTPQEFAHMLPGEVADWAQAVRITGATLD
jgi:tripartite-type tricarboxylate transporter receptor subunit TctC